MAHVAVDAQVHSLGSYEVVKLVEVGEYSIWLVIFYGLW